MKRFILAVALILTLGLFAQAQAWTPVAVNLNYVQESAQIHVYVTSQAKVNGVTLGWDQYLSTADQQTYTIGDKSIIDAKETLAANSVWAAQAQPTIPPPAPVTLGSSTGNPTTATTTVSTYQTNQQTINGFCSSSLVQQVINSLPQAAQLNLLSQIQTLLQNALPH